MLSNFLARKAQMVSADLALPGRSTPLPVPAQHYVNGHPLKPPFPAGLEQAVFGLGCFWGSERRSGSCRACTPPRRVMPAATHPDPAYEEVCTGRTGHSEVVLVVYDPKLVSYGQLLKAFWEAHDPTQGMRQGNDVGTQYRSVIYTYGAEQLQAAQDSLKDYQDALRKAGYPGITTEVQAAPEFYYAEDYHQQYLAKNPAGYCGLGGTGVSCPIGLAASAAE